MCMLYASEKALKMQSYNTAWQYANYLIQVAKQKPSKLLKTMKPDQKWKSLNQKLAELYVSSFSSPMHEGIFPGSHLLQKLVVKEKLNCLVLNLYSGNEGYSMMVKSRTGNDTETVHLSYEDDAFLQYVDNQELPPLLVDLLERSQANLFYNGCVIVEIRDFRKSSEIGAFNTYYSLLKPTTQSIISDVGLLTSDSQRWTWEERHALESSLLLATSEPLCLEPNISVSIVANYFQHSFLSRQSIKRVARDQSHVALSKKRKIQESAVPKYFRLHDFSVNKKSKLLKPAVMMDVNIKNVDPPIPDNFVLSTADVALVQKYAKPLPRPSIPLEYFPLVVEEYIMEIERNPGKIHNTKMTITQSPVDEKFFGTLCVSREGQSDGTSCSFPLGTRPNVDKYIYQFTEIFTEEGRKSVKTTHLVPGQPPKVTFTPGAREQMENNFSSVPSAPITLASAAKSSITSHSLSTASNSVSSGPHQISSMMADVSDAQLSVKTTTSSVSATDLLPSTVALTDSSGRPRSTSPMCVSISSAASLHDEVGSTNIEASGFMHSESISPSSGITGMNLNTLGLAQNLGLHNLVSITGMNVPQTLTVPISLAMVNSGQSTFLTSTGMMVGSVSGLGSSISPSSGESPPLLPLNPVMSNVESMPANEPSITAVTLCSAASLSSPTLIITTGVMTSPSSVLTNPTPSLLSLPLNVAASLGTTNVATQIVASNLKNTSSSLRPTTVSLLQVSSGQPSAVPLIGAMQHSLSQPMRHTTPVVQNQPVSTSIPGISECGILRQKASQDLS